MRISESVIEAAAKANCPDVQTWEAQRDSRMDDAGVIIEVALAELGAVVEGRGKMFPAKRKGFMEHRDIERRIVTAWEPIDADTLESA